MRNTVPAECKTPFLAKKREEFWQNWHIPNNQTRRVTTVSREEQHARKMTLYMLHDILAIHRGQKEILERCFRRPICKPITIQHAIEHWPQLRPTG